MATANKTSATSRSAGNRTTASSSTSTTILPGQKVTIKAGSYVNVNGKSTRRSTPSVVTVRAAKPARNGKTRVFWKSNGYIANAVI